MRRRSIVPVALKCVALTAILLSSAGRPAIVRGQQQPPATPRPQPLLDPAGFVREDAYSPALLPDAERAYGRIDGLKMKAIVNEIVAISRQSRDEGNKYWGRIAGTKYEAMTADLVEARFRKLGMVAINRPEFTLRPQWFPVDWEVTASGGGKTLSFTTARPALGAAPIPSAGLDVEAVWVGLGTAPDFAGRDVRGKAVVIHSMLAPGQMGQSAIFEAAFKRAADAGATAIIAVWGYYENMAVWQGFGRRVLVERLSDGILHRLRGRQETARSDRRRPGQAETPAARRNPGKPQVDQRVRDAAGRHRREHHRHGSHGRLVRRGARQRLRH